MRFRADQHLRRASDFDHVRTQGRRYDCGAFVLYYAPRRQETRHLANEAAPGCRLDSWQIDSLATPPAAPAAPATAAATTAPLAPARVFPARAGFVASRSAVGNAVARARAKRRLREKFRAHQTAFPPGVDLVFVARRSLNGLEPAALEQRFLDLCRKLFLPRAT